jgi:beta-lactamase regulating signal transducer with metallopeptidase domain
MNFIETAFRLILDATWQMACIILVLLLLRPILSRHVSAHFLYLAWIAIAIRLIIPTAIPVRWSPFNLAGAKQATGSSLVGDTDPAQPGSDFTQGNVTVPVAAKQITHGHASPGRAPQRSLFQAAAVLWSGGALVLLLARAFAHWRFAARLRRDDALAECVLNAMDGELAAAFRRSRISLFFTDAIDGPALHGILRPKLLFPVGFLDKLTPTEIQLIVAHELGHYRRYDLVAQFLLQLARALHWFNPLVWVATRAARNDCELACDDYVMRRFGAIKPHVYGATLLKIFGMASPSTKAPLVLGIVESKHELKRRIQMIIARKSPTFTSSFVGGLFLALVAGIALTREAQAQQPTPSVLPAPTDVSAPSTAPTITSVPPTGWVKNGNYTPAYVVGVDRGQIHDGMPSAFVKCIKLVQEGAFGGMMQMCSPDNFKGKRLRVSAWMKTTDVSEKGAHIWFRVDGDEKGKMLQFDNMLNRAPVGSTDWHLYSVVLDVPANATALAYGFFVSGSGQAWVSDFKVEEVGLDVPNTNMDVEAIKGRDLPKTPVNLGFN